MVLAMAKTNALPTYATINESLKIMQAQGDASENHGLLSGLLAVGSKVNRSAWINALVLDDQQQDDKIMQGAKKALTQLFDVTKAAFKSDDYDFSLLLPEDNASFPLRIEAFAHWCQGFVTGLNLVGVDTKQKGESDVHEALADLLNFSLLRYDNETEDDEDAEKAYVSLVEYAKVAVLLLHRDNHELHILQKHKH